MNYDNRNSEDQCVTCKQPGFSYIIKTIKSKLGLLICENCYNKSNTKEEYVSKQMFKEYQMLNLQQTQPYLFEILNFAKDEDHQSFLTEDQIQLLMDVKNKIEGLEKILTDIEQGRSEQIIQLLYIIKQYQQEQQQYINVLNTLKFGQQMKHLERVDKLEFQKQQLQFFEQFSEYYKVKTYQLIQNQAVSEIRSRIENKDDFPPFLQIVGKHFQQNQHPNSDYYGFIDENSMKTGLGFWDPKQKQQKYQYFGIFYQNIMLFGIKIVIQSNTQYTLYEGFFYPLKGQQDGDVQINGDGVMFSKDYNEQFHEYQGNFLNEKRHGKGTYIWKSNEKKQISRYSGSWQNNQYHGYGSLSIQEQNIIIDGEFNFGQPIFEKCQIKGQNIPQQTLKDYVIKEQTQKLEENSIPKQQFKQNFVFQPPQNPLLLQQGQQTQIGQLNQQQMFKMPNEFIKPVNFGQNIVNQTQQPFQVNFQRDQQNNQFIFNQNNFQKK